MTLKGVPYVQFFISSKATFCLWLTRI